jgi:hypothetical protein
MPYCPACRADYAPGTERCHDCEIDLEEPGQQEGATPADLPPEPLVTVASFDTPLKANILASRLEAEGVQCFIADAETIGLHGPAGERGRRREDPSSTVRRAESGRDPP